MVHVASADATVGGIEAKYNFLLWRPVHAIQRADTDVNPWRGIISVLPNDALSRVLWPGRRLKR